MTQKKKGSNQPGAKTKTEKQKKVKNVFFIAANKLDNGTNCPTLSLKFHLYCSLQNFTNYFELEKAKCHV